MFKLLQTTLYFDLHRSNACCLLHNILYEDPEQIVVFNSPVLQQYPKNGCGLNLVAAAASCARARENMQMKIIQKNQLPVKRIKLLRKQIMI